MQLYCPYLIFHFWSNDFLIIKTTKDFIIIFPQMVDQVTLEKVSNFQFQKYARQYYYKSAYINFETNKLLCISMSI